MDPVIERFEEWEEENIGYAHKGDTSLARVSL